MLLWWRPTRGRGGGGGENSNAARRHKGEELAADRTGDVIVNQQSREGRLDNGELAKERIPRVEMRS